VTSKTRIIGAIYGALFIAAISTLGDFMWAEVLPRPHPAWYGVVHGFVLFVCIGLVLGSPVGRRAEAAVGAAVIGCVASIAFYLLAPHFGYSVMFPLWFAFWIALGGLNERLGNVAIRWRVAIGRGVVASILSGVAFYLISGIWFPFDPHGWDYLVHFGAWTFAYFPGFASLLVGRET
jgi:hypothetical protein